MNRNLLRAAVTAGALSLALVGAAVPAQARVVANSDAAGRACFDPDAAGAARGTTVRTAHGDHRDISAAEQARVEKQTRAILAAKGGRKHSPSATNNQKNAIPVYVHVMQGADGSGNVTDRQIAQQIEVLNTDYSGADTDSIGGGVDTGVRFFLAGTDHFLNDAWHHDQDTTYYRPYTRQGGANALNIWLVDFDYLGIATFPWDYSKKPGLDGIRVQYDSLPGGDITHYNLGKTATHETGHWLGLYHTFQGGCTKRNDQVADTPAQSGPTSGCPQGADTCRLPGLDPIHNYMDYSYDDCYSQLTAGQSARIDANWVAYRQ